MSTTFDRIYASLPVPAQHVACSVEGYRVKRARYGASFERTFAAYVDRSAWNAARTERLRRERVESFVQHAARATSFYRGSVRTIEDAPILRRSDVQDHATHFTVQTPGEAVAIHHTSGSTGTGLRFPVTRSAAREQWAVWWRYRSWHGIPFDAWCGYFGGRSVVPVGSRPGTFWRFNWPGRQIMFSAYHISPESVDRYLDALDRHQPEWLHGYPSILMLLAAHMLETGRALRYQPKWITTGAENLVPFQRERIAAAFRVSPRQHYGQAEGVANISECPRGRLHVDEDYSYVEFIPAADGAFRIIGTNFTNPAFPLLRYDTGDLARLSEEECDCGRPGRIVESIDGRQEDCVTLPGGERVGRLDHIFKDQINVREAQIYQPDDRRIVLRIVRGPRYEVRDETNLLRETTLRLGSRLGVSVEYVSAIERTASGKLRFVVSEVKAS